jgi:hypothetical protein
MGRGWGLTRAQRRDARRPGPVPRPQSTVATGGGTPAAPDRRAGRSRPGGARHCRSTAGDTAPSPANAVRAPGIVVARGERPVSPSLAATYPAFRSNTRTPIAPPLQTRDSARRRHHRTAEERFRSAQTWQRRRSAGSDGRRRPRIEGMQVARPPVDRGIHGTGPAAQGPRRRRLSGGTGHAAARRQGRAASPSAARSSPRSGAKCRHWSRPSR